MDNTQQLVMRRLQYRLQRQGMLELDAWLSPLLLALSSADEQLVLAVSELLELEAPELLAMQTGKIDIPEELQPWLKV